MSCHFSVLPAELLQSLSTQLANTPLSDESKADARGLPVLRLPHPRTGIPTLFVPHETPQSSTILEIQSVCPPNRRSWFTQKEVVEDGKLLVMTPVDPMFLLVRLVQITAPSDGTLGTFRTLDDIMEDAATKASLTPAEDGASALFSEDVLHLSNLRCVHAAMRRICEFKEITPEITVFRYSAERTQECLRAKVTRLSDQNITELSRTLNRNLAKDGLLEDGKEDLLTSARVRVACDLVSQYLPRDVYERLLSSYDFVSLNGHLKVLKEESMALAAVNMSTVEAREAKGQKDETVDKKRKVKGPHGVEQLKKANTRGMAKLSTFFQKK
ncbi:ribonuclease H2, subunit B [Trametes gibbosa]|nr:ribonuclease H2, subunit B [Trametes gibbosa]